MVGWEDCLQQSWPPLPLCWDQLGQLLLSILLGAKALHMHLDPSAVQQERVPGVQG